MDRSTRDIASDPEATPGAGWAFGLLTAAVVFGVFASGGPLQVTQGVMAVVVGLGLLLAAPGVAVPRLWWALAGAVVVMAALAFLPKAWGFDPEWRRQVEALGVPTGGHITAHPAVSFQHWVRLLLTVAVGLWILGHRLTDRGHARVLLTVAWAAGAYAALSVALSGRSDRWVWDPVENFGLFANRSHTATLLVVGLLCALTAMAHHIRHGRGGRAGLATLPGMLCAGALLGYSISRAGLLLLGLGLAAWIAGTAARGWSRRTTFVVVPVLVAVAALFWFSDAEIKSRLLRPVPVPAAAAAADPAAAPAVQLDIGVQEDGRWLIFHDTLDLIRDTWLTGIGRGMFEHVIPQYRQRSACESQCLHPESDWLMLAAEAGAPCALALAALVAAVAVAAVRTGWRRRGWSLRWGGLVAAMVVPVHGLFDMPGHLPVLGLLTLLLAAAAFRPPGGDPRPAGAGARLAMRLAGVAAVAGGGGLLWAEWGRGRPSPVVAAPFAINEATRLWNEDRDAQRTAASASGSDAAADSPASSAESPEDLLRQALAVTAEGLRNSPLNTTLHYQRGMLALHFDELDAVADQAFAVQRVLEPMPPGLALRQAQGWVGIDPERAAGLWADALRRAQETARVSSWVHPGAAGVQQQIVQQARTSDLLMQRALELARPDPAFLSAWAGHSSPALLDAEMPALLATASPDDRSALLALWKSRGSRGAADAHEAGR